MLNVAIHDFNLAVNLQVVGWTHFQLGSQHSKLLLPKFDDENGVIVINDGFQLAMEFDDVFYKSFRYNFYREQMR